MKRSRSSFLGDTEPESIEALAERVLFSGSLSEKLAQRPLYEEIATVSNPVRSGTLPSSPDRPAGLGFAKGSEARPALPSRPSLVDETSRGVLLHFFANHELLAAELMALALLKFPDAPPAFRRGLAETLREEQRHTRWYLARMAECGVEFGSYPLSPYFWDAVSPMESPLDYVSRLSLTFEQANLDYARHYSEVLAEAGDAKSASILRHIYEDEISHVRYGLEWFRKWKPAGESDWEALKKRLVFPLSPSRAKGNRALFNEEGRRAAGFDEDYIRHLALFERSKGRTPNVHFFNPEVEHRAARWPAPYHPDRQRLDIVRDLEILQGFLARRDDVLLMRRRPSQAHLERLAACGLGLPEIEELAPDGSVDRSGLLAARKVNQLRPWSIAPDLADRFSELRASETDGDGPLVWNESKRRLFSKVEQIAALRQWSGESHPCRTDEELNAAVAALLASGHRKFVVKRAFSTAGSGIRALSAEELSALPERGLKSAVVAEGGVLLEPRHDRVFDFSVQFLIGNDQIRRLGFVEQIITRQGGYRGSIVRTKFCKDHSPALARFLMNEVLGLYVEDGPFAADLLAWANRHGYRGNLGIDAYVHRLPDGSLALRALCEINPRCTMGLVALELKRRIRPGRDLLFEIVRAADANPSVTAEMDESGRLSQGTVILTEVTPTTHYVARCSVLE